MSLCAEYLALKQCIIDTVYKLYSNIKKFNELNVKRICKEYINLESFLNITEINPNIKSFIKDIINEINNHEKIVVLVHTTIYFCFCSHVLLLSDAPFLAKKI